jgi:peptidyl-dipeptidase Dcp
MNLSHACIKGELTLTKILAARKGPHRSLDFSAFDSNDYEPSLNEAIERSKILIEKVKSAPANFKATVVGLEDATEDVDFIYNVFTNLMLADSTEKVRELAQILGPKISDFYNDILLDPEIFAKLKQVYDQRASLALSTEDDRLLDRMFSDFQRRGALLNPEQKARLREIDQELARIYPKFGENVLKSTNEFKHWIDDPKELLGLPDSFREAAFEAAKENGRDGQWLITLNAPSYLPVMKFAEIRALREKVWRAFNERAFGGKYDNQKHATTIVRLMHEKSNLLGFKSYAHFALEKRMAETPELVMEFLNRLLDAAKPFAEKEVKAVQQLASSLGGPSELQPWDFTFYAEKLKEQRYDFDEETLRPYFPLSRAVAGVMDHAHKLYGLEFIKSENYSSYHSDVDVYDVFQETSREFVGVFYTDFFPRASKSQGAWMTNYLEQGCFHGELARPHVSIVCNFTKPTGSKPSLLTFDEVSTLFHEFGHALHSLLSKCQYRSLSGTNVFLDFVELPSQIMENWLREPESLNLFARHHISNEVLPKDLVEKVKKSDMFLVGYHCVRQLTFAFLDMAWFTVDPKQITSVPEFEEQAIAKTQLLPPVPGTNISCQFTHVFSGGYSAGYYSYKWAEALDADAFEFFKQEGIFDQSVAQAFAENILSRGGSEHPMRLFEKFRGRKPDPDALLRRDGMINS